MGERVPIEAHRLPDNPTRHSTQNPEKFLPRDPSLRLLREANWAKLLDKRRWAIDSTVYSDGFDGHR